MVGANRANTAISMPITAAPAATQTTEVSTHASRPDAAP
jgi:hypothetical protein